MDQACNATAKHHRALGTIAPRFISIVQIEPMPREKSLFGILGYPEPEPVAEWDAEDIPYDVSRLFD